MVAREANTASTPRRGFVGSAAATLGLAAVGGGFLAGLQHLRRRVPAPSGARRGLGILRPPGALSEAEFLGACIRCTRCADACEPGCIRLFGPEGGTRQGTPYIDPLRSACTLCLLCGPACPTEALVVLGDKRDARMGTAVIDKRLCVSHNGTGVCGACFTACPLRGAAIQQGIRNAPEVSPEHCVGCGLCEEYCIVDDRDGLRAIQVTTGRNWNTAVSA